MDARSQSGAAPRPPGLAWLELLRLPNVFTAAADVLLGFLLANRSFEKWPVCALLLGASCSLYLAGMVLNDYFDRHVDAGERPGRPIPSGRISPRAACRLGYGLLLAGVLCGVAAALVQGNPRPAATALFLAAAVWSYDAALKQTFLGPLAMGICRFLNVLLGASAGEYDWSATQFIVAGGIGVYILGVTLLARTEESVSRRLTLVLASLTMLAGLALTSSYPFAAPDWERQWLLVPDHWFLFWGAIASLIGWRCAAAIILPAPKMVQAAVRNAILSLIVIDAAAGVPAAGAQRAMIILLLIIPAMFLGRWIYST